jgi:GNAT superfamily N-acetyltransferase
MSIVAISEQPELAPMVAAWPWGAFFQHPGAMDVQALTALILLPAVGAEETFVLFDGPTPVGTASLAAQDLDARPDLTPWLAGVFVREEFRGRGHASRLVRRVEGFARDHGVTRLWLFTQNAAPLYAGLGWLAVGIEEEHGLPVTLMRRDLAP